MPGDLAAGDYAIVAAETIAKDLVMIQRNQGSPNGDAVTGFTHGRR